MVRWLILTAVAAIATANCRNEAMRAYLNTQRYEANYYLPTPKSLAILSMGHREALADLVWMKALIYFGDELRHRGEVEHVYRYARTILHLDPDFRKAYLWAAVAGLYRPHATPLEEMLPAVEILRDGVRRFPDDPQMAWELGSTLMYEVVPLTEDASEQQRLRAEATDHLIVAVHGGSAPPWLALNNLSQLRELGQLDRAAAHLREAYALADDESTRLRIAERLAEVDGAVGAAAMEAEFLRLTERWRSERPWVPFEFFWLVTHAP